MRKRFLILLMVFSLTLVFAACTKNDAVIPASGEVKEAHGLYPAYLIEGSDMKWGYINEEGKFIIEPKYEGVTDFKSNGLAEVMEKEGYRLIDKSGKSIMTSQYLYTSSFSETLTVVSDATGMSYLMDEKGQKIFETEGSIEKLSNGLAAFSKKVSQDKTLWGYIDEAGKVVIEPSFQWAEAFSNDKAIVQRNNGGFGIINKEGQLIIEKEDAIISKLSQEIFVFSKAATGNGTRYGYMTTDGNIMLEAIYSDAQAFDDNGLAVVNAAPDFENQYGVIDKTGKFIIEPQYGLITSLGNGIYAVPMGQDVYYNVSFVPKALFDKTGKQLTDFKYYDLERLENGLISVTDDKNTYLIDDKGNEVSITPKIEGIGRIGLNDNIYKVEADNKLFYLTQEGKQIWTSDNTIKLADGLQIKTNSFRPDRCMLIQYPELSGLADSATQEKINSQLKELFIGDRTASEKDGEMFIETIDVNFSADKNKDLLIISESGYFYPIGAAHGQPSRMDYHIDLKNGNLYTLEDLFVENSNYKEKLTGIIKGMIAAINEEHAEQIYYDDFEDFEEFSGFAIQKDSLKIYFYPYAIASYAAGFPEFDIPYEQLTDVINTSGELWNSFERASLGESEKVNYEVYPSEKTKIEDAMKNYENTLIEAINQNDFSLVEPWLYKDSSLYNSQIDLVADLNQKQIKERLDSYSIEKIEMDSLGTIYRVYVTENIGIQYPGKDSESKQFHWIYSLKYDYDNQKYQLTYIKKWEK